MAPVREIVDSWASLYANSAAIRSGVAFLHVGALLGGGGSAIAADLGTLRAIKRGADALRAELDRLREVHRLVAVSLIVVVLSGALLVAADLDTFLASRTFWFKMTLVALLVLNGAVLAWTGARAESGDASASRRLRIAALLSLTLWFATTLLGAVLPNA